MSLENFIESNKVFLRIIEEQQRQIGELETKLEQREYNRRFTNTKLINKSLAKTGGTFYVQADGDIKPTKGKKK